jgi:hypothetical protein
LREIGGTWGKNRRNFNNNGELRVPRGRGTVVGHLNKFRCADDVFFSHGKASRRSGTMGDGLATFVVLGYSMHVSRSQSERLDMNSQNLTNHRISLIIEDCVFIANSRRLSTAKGVKHYESRNTSKLR